MYLLIDIGGTKMRMGYSPDGFVVEKVKVVDTSENYNDGLEQIKSYFEFLESPHLRSVSVAMPGIFNKEKSAIIKCKNLEGWVNKPVKKDLSEILNSDVILANDAKMAGLGEAVFGAGKGFNIVAYLTVSTGVGGARVVNGKISEDSMELEPGHQILDIDGTVDPEFIRPNNRYSHGLTTLERLIAGRDLEIKYGKSLKEIDDNEIWKDMAKNLAAGISNMVVFWRPDIVILGGGVGMSHNLKIEDLESELDYFMTLSIEKPVIKKSSLGDLSALYGALEFIKNQN